MRTTEEITNTIIQNIDSTGSLVEVQPGSDLYTISRAFATVINELDNEVQDAKESVSINDAEGQDLDEWASSFYLSRREGSTSKGKVLALAESNETIPVNTRLVDLETGLQFFTTEEVKLNRFVEKPISIEAAKESIIHNLSAGTELYADSFRDIQFIVGSHRDEQGTVCGDLSGGRPVESDEQLRSRIVNKLVNQKTNSEFTIKSIVLAEPDVVWVDVETPLPGYLVVWIDSITTLSQDRLNYFRSLVNLNTAAGILTEVKESKKLGVDFSVTVFPDTGDDSLDLNELTSRIKKRLIRFLYKLSLNESLIVEQLRGYLAKTEGVDDVRVDAPDQDVELGEDNVVRPTAIRIRYDYTS